MSEQFSRQPKPASGDRNSKKHRPAQPANKPLQSGDRVKFNGCCGSVFKSDLFSDNDPIEFVLFDGSRAQPVPIERRFLKVLPEEF